MPEVEESKNQIQVKNIKKKFLNGWTYEQEKLLAEWADIAMCYRWLHDRAEKYYKHLNYLITIPVIILSTLTGTASVGLSSVVGDNLTAQKYAQLGIGGVSIITGILSTLGNYLRFAQLQEGNRNAALNWSKFHRMIRSELSLHPDRRQDCQDFLKHCRNDLDRMLENAPEIHVKAIDEFNSKIGSIKDIKLPNVIDNLEKTEIFSNDNLRLKQLALETALVINSKKELMKDLEFSESDIKLYEKIEKRLKNLREEEYGDIGKLDLTLSSTSSLVSSNTSKIQTPVAEINKEALENELVLQASTGLSSVESNNKITVKVDESKNPQSNNDSFFLKPIKNIIGVPGGKI
jgi:hypothetical protein